MRWIALGVITLLALHMRKAGAVDVPADPHRRQLTSLRLWTIVYTVMANTAAKPTEPKALKCARR